MTPMARMNGLALCLRVCNPEWARKGTPMHNVTKVCSCCDERKPVEQFYLKENKRNGSMYRDGQCKKCRIAKVQQRVRAA